MNDASQSDAPTDVSEGYLLSMDDALVTWDIPGWGGKYFIEAKHPGLGEDKVQRAAVKLNIQQGDNKVEDVRIIGDVATAQAFVEKCATQITSFCLPAQENGKPTDKKWSPANEGDNRDNRRLYVRLLASKSEIEGKAFPELLAGFLDQVAGRDTPAREDYEALGED